MKRPNPLSPALMSPMERRAEETHFKKWFGENGFELYDLPEDIGFEGAGDCLFDRGGDWLWTGYGFRTEIEAHEEIRKFFDVDLVSIKLTDPRFPEREIAFEFIPQSIQSSSGVAPNRYRELPSRLKRC